MVAVAVGVLWSGYALAWWGWEQLHGRGTSFHDLIVPGAYRPGTATPQAKPSAQPARPGEVPA